MYTLKIEHSIRDFPTWRDAFARDPIGRQRAGVRQHRICQPAGDPHYVIVDLDFDQRAQAEAFLQALQNVWRRPELSPALDRDAAAVAPRARIVEQVDSQTY